jgi:thioredoxin reductase (NADPH)
MIESATRDRELLRAGCLCVGGGDAAVENALLLAEVCPTVTLVHRGKKLRARREFTEQASSSSLHHGFHGVSADAYHWRRHVEAVEIQAKAGLKPFQLAVRGVLIRIGVETEHGVVQEQLETDEKGISW